MAAYHISSFSTLSPVWNIQVGPALLVKNYIYLN